MCSKGHARLLLSRFDFEAAQSAPRWHAELTETHRPETDEYGVSSAVYKARQPFHPQRLWIALFGTGSGAVDEGAPTSKGANDLAARGEGTAGLRGNGDAAGGGRTPGSSPPALLRGVLRSKGFFHVASHPQVGDDKKLL